MGTGRGISVTLSPLISEAPQLSSMPLYQRTVLSLSWVALSRVILASAPSRQANTSVMYPFSP